MVRSFSSGYTSATGRCEVRPVVSLTGQMYAFFMTVLAGVSVGLLFDFYRVFRSGMRPKRWVSVLCDLLYWTIVTPVVFLLLLIGNWAELRYYVFLGMGLGIFVYFQLMSSFVLWACVSLYHAVTALFLGVSRFFVALLVWPFRILGGLGLSSGRTAFLGGATGRGRPRSRRMRWRIWNPSRLFRQ